MASAEDSQYRFNIARGFIAEARQDMELERWRSCVDNSQLVVENAGKAVLALLGPVGRTHEVAERLSQNVSLFPPSAQETIPRLARLAQRMGWDVHVSSDYGDEDHHRTPWEIFDEDFARQALAMAEDALSLAEQIIERTREAGG